MILETKKDIDNFLNYWNTEPCLIFPVWADTETHPMNNDISFLYVRFRDDETDQGLYKMDYILPFNHNDCERLNIDLTRSTQKKKTFYKKGLLQTNLGIQNLYDMQADNFFNNNELYQIDEKIGDLTGFYTRLGLHDDLGKSIPIMKWIEVLRGITTPLINIILYSFTDNWVDQVMIPILSKLEQHGIHIDKKKFINRFPNAIKHIKENKVYTEYNPYTITSRPSNHHAGINYGALNKNDGTREIFIPGFDKIFLSFDYDAYHVRLIAKMINFKLPKTSTHLWLANMYGCNYTESKSRTFRILYGGVNTEDKKIPFFNKVDLYIQKIYNKAKKYGYVKTPSGRKIFLNWIDNATPQKVFNYLLQATETETNMKIISKLYENGINSLCLYSYDAFLFEYDKNNGVNEAKNIKNILESFGYPVKASWGTDYSQV